MFNEHGEHDNALIIWTLCACAFFAILISALGG